MSATRKNKPHPKRSLASMMFIQWKYDSNEIAAELDISETTLSKWRSADNWDTQRQFEGLTSQNLIKNYYEESQGIIDDAKADGRRLNSKEVDMLAKLASSIEKLNKKTSPSVAMQVFMDFNNFVKTVDLDLAKKIIPLEKDFVFRLLNPS
jgi:uncharacterized protein YjcR